MQVFKNDPYVIVWKAFKSLYPDKECSVYFDDEMDLSEDGQPVYGFTNFPLDESDGIVICISSNISISDSVEVLAHELAHVAVGESFEHGKEWEDAFDKIHAKYSEIAQELFGEVSNDS